MLVHVPPPLEIRDPVHGAIAVDRQEAAVIDHSFVQRLRGIRQLGFSHLPFPGATHSRYAHSLGAMHLAGRAFDACFRGDDFPSPDRRAAFRHCVRLAALCHDLGHAPYSHAAEFAMPILRDLGVAAYAPAAIAHRLDALATHEDYTVAILTESTLSETIQAHFDFGPKHVAALVSHEVEVEDGFFMDQGVDMRGALSQLISSDLDVDRLDYLMRDSHYTGARYGEIDVHWLLSHLNPHVDGEGRVCLALDRRAIYAFDDYMVARFHMFVMVYFHQKSIAYEGLLKRAMQHPDCDYHLPADLEAYRHCDDTHLESWLRTSAIPAARAIVEHRPPKVVLESHGPAGGVDLSEGKGLLGAAGLDVMEISATGGLVGKAKAGAPDIHIIDHTPGRSPTVELIGESSRVYSRFEDACCIGRLYVPRAELDEARRLLESA